MARVVRIMLGAAMAIGLAMGHGCKRNQTPGVAEIWDEEPTLEKTEALGTLSPPWQSPARIVLEDGLVTFWLHEPGTPVLHLRLLIPTAARHDVLDAASARLTAEVLRRDLARRLRRQQLRVQLDHGPGRLELALHGHDVQLERVLVQLGRAVSARPDMDRYRAAARSLVDDLRSAKTTDVGVALLTAELLGLPASSQWLEASALEGPSRLGLQRAWAALTDPRQAILVVHSGRSADELEPALAKLNDTWKRRAGLADPEPALDRLQPPHAPTPGTTRLLTEPAAPLRVSPIEARGKPVVVLGRAIPVDDPKAKSLARLSQRLVQEEIDARMTISGRWALFIVRIALRGNEPAEKLQAAIDELGELIDTRPQTQHLFQAAQLWLGARVVRASLQGEDWTKLWSQAIDLAEDETTIGLALARDAATMMDHSPQAVHAWARRWLDPRGGQGGWRWWVVGADRRQLEDLAELVPLRDRGETLKP